MLSFPYVLAIYSTGVIGLALLLFYELCVNKYIEEMRHSSHRVAEIVRGPTKESPAGYLVNSPSCKIPDLNPFHLSTSGFVRRKSHTEFYSQPPLTEVVYNPKTEQSCLEIKREAVKFYTKHDTVYCCLSAIQQTHLKVQLSSCDYLSNKTWILNDRFQQLIVSCYDLENVLVYENLHATVVRAKRRKRELKPVKKNRLNVLVVGLDSMSRLNLYRTMPQTVTHLHTHGWTELRGYTKIADNTLPNLMALLTGIPPDRLISTHRRFFDGYPFVWKEFAADGYVTAYVEDQPSLGTFNCHLKGFVRRPTDYYPLSFFRVAESYSYFREKQSYLGFKTSSDHLFGYLRDFAQTHSKDPFFGFFWVNDFSHNNLNQPSSEDTQVLKTLQSLEQLGTFNTTMVVFLSDHGVRVGDFRKTRIGWYEDRLPFLFVSIPEWYKSKHDKDYANLLSNADKLISPFDVYKTLSHVLHGDNLKEPIGCETCYSLLTEVPSNRSCADAGVSPHWCACHDLVELPVSRSTTKYWADLVVSAINKKIEQDRELEIGYTCAVLSVQDVLYFRKKLSSTEYVIGIQTQPGGAQFEATIVKRGYSERVEDSVSRLNEYGTESHCAKKPSSKILCYCVDVGINEAAPYYSLDYYT